MSVSKSSSFGMSLVFPDVCITPASPIPVPIPYPNFATTALAKQKAATQPTAHKQAVASKSPVSSRPGMSMTAGLPQKVMSSANVKITGEVTQLIGELDRLHNNMRQLPATDPNAWQTALQQYVVAAAALYVTKRDD
jgi:hypothetical protein